MLKVGGELIIHAGTNNTTENPGSVSAQIAALCESVVAEGFDVPISSIIHRRWETTVERRRVDAINNLLEIAAQQNSWGYISNDNIKEQHLGHDGVHLSRSGVRFLAANLSRHISRGYSTGNHSSRSQKSFADVAAGKTEDSSVGTTGQMGPQLSQRKMPNNDGRQMSTTHSIFLWYFNKTY